MAVTTLKENQVSRTSCTISLTTILQERRASIVKRSSLYPDALKKLVPRG